MADFAAHALDQLGREVTPLGERFAEPLAEDRGESVDLADGRAAVAKYTPLHPTVFIFHCTFVCDARCEMCSNWTRGNRKEDMTLEQIERAFSSTLWKDIENASISGGEPTTRNDLVEIARVMVDKFPKLRKLTLNTTGITHHRAIPMLTKIVELCHERNIIFSTRVSIDGVGEMHNKVRSVKRGFEKAKETIRAMKELQKRYSFNFGISSTIFTSAFSGTSICSANDESCDICDTGAPPRESRGGSPLRRSKTLPPHRCERPVVQNSQLPQKIERHAITRSPGFT